MCVPNTPTPTPGPHLGLDGLRREHHLARLGQARLCRHAHANIHIHIHVSMRACHTHRHTCGSAWPDTRTRACPRRAGREHGRLLAVTRRQNACGCRARHTHKQTRTHTHTCIHRRARTRRGRRCVPPKPGMMPNCSSGRPSLAPGTATLRGCVWVGRHAALGRHTGMHMGVRPGARVCGRKAGKARQRAAPCTVLLCPPLDSCCFLIHTRPRVLVSYTLCAGPLSLVGLSRR
jgi:hypothetical protein